LSTVTLVAFSSSFFFRKIKTLCSSKVTVISFYFFFLILSYSRFVILKTPNKQKNSTKKQKMSSLSFINLTVQTRPQRQNRKIKKISSSAVPFFSFLFLSFFLSHLLFRFKTKKKKDKKKIEKLVFTYMFKKIQLDFHFFYFFPNFF